MQEKVFIQIYKCITSQDVSCFRPDQVDEMIKIKAECGLECRIKRVFINEEVQPCQ